MLGLDTNLIAEAKATGLFAPHGIETPALDLPIAWDDDTFLPYDWGYFAFVYDKAKMPVPPKSFEDLIASDASIVIHDPRSSTPGLGLLMWVKDAYGDRAPEIWQGLKPHIVTVAPGWSEAYGLFLEGEVDMALAYTTSPAYHLIAEDDDGKAAAIFDEGQYMQVEVAAMTAISDQPDLARAFLRFMLTDGFQGVIPTTNWMYPAHTPAVGLPGRLRDAAAAGEAAALLAGGGAGEARRGAGGMAGRAQPISAAVRWGGGLALALVAALTLGTVAALLSRAEPGRGLGPAEWAALRFTLVQALLSAA